MSFGLRLKELRKSHKMSQSELSQHIEIGQSTIAEYERDTLKPGADNLVKIATVFNVSLDYLLGITSVKERHPNQPINMVRNFTRPIINGKPATDDQLDKIWEIYKIMKSVALEDEEK
jgi:transcriptional regulator with XRE-family HTH domain